MVGRLPGCCPRATSGLSVKEHHVKSIFIRIFASRLRAGATLGLHNRRGYRHARSCRVPWGPALRSKPHQRAPYWLAKGTLWA